VRVASSNTAGGNTTGGATPGTGADSTQHRGLLSTGAAAALSGVSERSLRYYQQLGLITPCGKSPGGMRRYSEQDLARVARIRELQALLGLNLDEIAVVLRNEDRTAEIREAYHDQRTGTGERAERARECLALQENLRAIVETKRAALDKFLADLDVRIARNRAVLG
jgi:DNA-binding transcriptional MerR regulator